MTDDEPAPDAHDADPASAGEDRRPTAADRRAAADPSVSPPPCHRRGCEEPAAFAVLERYQEETGQGAVEAEALLCIEHTAEESPVNLEGVYDDYLFRVTPLPGTLASDGE